MVEVCSTPMVLLVRMYKADRLRSPRYVRARVSLAESPVDNDTASTIERTGLAAAEIAAMGLRLPEKASQQTDST